MPHQPTIMVWKSESAPKLHAGGPSEIHHFNLDVERLEIFGMHPEQQADYHVSGKVTFKGKAPAEFGRKDLVAVCVLDTAHLLSEKTKLFFF